MILAGAWIVVIWLIGVEGDFPLNDDWAYGKSVWKLVEEGKYVPGDWPSMTLLAQIIWGSVFCWFFGLSFVSLRCGTLVLALIGTIGLYKLSTRFTSNRDLALLLSLTWLFNPVALSLSFTYMTEIYFQTAFILGVYSFVRLIETQELKYYLGATVFSILATLVRQPGLLLPFVFGISMINFSQGWRKSLEKLLPFVFTLAIYLCYNYWLTYQGLNSGNDDRMMAAITSFLGLQAHHYYYQVVNLLLFPGFFLLPLLVVLLPGLKARKMRWGFVLVPLFICFLLFDRSGFPVGNIMYNLGLGPKIMKDTYWGDNIDPMLPTSMWQLCKAAAFPSLFMLAALWRKERSVKIRHVNFRLQKGMDQVRLSLTLFVIIYSIFILVLNSFFDRYLLPLVPCLALLILPVRLKVKRKFLLGGGAVLALYAIFAVAATHDYLSWNRARWEAFRFVTDEKGKGPNDIDAGFEINAWYQAGSARPSVKGEKSWWFVSDDEYVLSFGPIHGFTSVGGIPYRRWLPPGNDSIDILWHDIGGARPYEHFPLRVGAEKVSGDGLYFLSDVHDVEFTAASLRSSERARSGQFGIRLTEKRPFALLTRYRDVKPGERFMLSVWRWGESDRSAGIVFSSDYGNAFYRFESANVVERDDQGWEKILLDITLPDTIDFDKAASYVWSIKEKEAWLDDFAVDRRPPVRKQKPSSLGYGQFPLLVDAEELTGDGYYFLAQPHGVRFKNTDLITTERAHSGKHAIALDGKRAFAWNVHFGDLVAGEEIDITLWIYGAPKSLAIVFSSLDEGGFYRLEAENIVAKSKEGWRKLRHRVTVPSGANFDEAASYLWNRGGEQVWVDDLEIRRVKPGKKQE